MPRSCRDRCFYIPENAIEPGRFPDVPRHTPAAASPLRAAFIGRLVPYKGLDMLIEAAADLLRAGRMTLEIVGDGPQLGELRTLLDRLELVDRVKFWGRLDHHEVAAVLCRCDVMTFPSIREFGGGVVVEAMAVGTVPIVINYGGPAELATERTGFLVEPGTREQIIQRLSSLLTQLCNTPELVISRSGPARHRARTHFTWEAKAKQVMQVYRWALGQSQEKPVFPIPTPDDIY
jgi:glycosyltransferase involved in cell wall biosynthesis